MTREDLMTAEIAVIIVNYKTAALSIAAVNSVLALNHGGRSVSVHLVDNASGTVDQDLFSKAQIEFAWSGKVKLYFEETNHGFGRGNNVALHWLAAQDVQPDKVLLLNPDARLSNEAIEILAAFMDETPAASAVGASVVLPDGTPTAAAFRFPSLASEIDKAANFGPISHLLSGSKTSVDTDGTNMKVDWVSGAAVMFKFDRLADVAFFDPTYFLYYEEVDLMLQLTRAGGENWYVPAAKVIHEEGASTGVSPVHERRRRPLYLYESWVHYFTKNHGRLYAFTTATIVFVAAMFNYLHCAVRRRRIWLPLHFLSDHLRHALIPIALGKRRTPSK